MDKAINEVEEIGWHAFQIFKGESNIVLSRGVVIFKHTLYEKADKGFFRPLFISV